MIDVSIWLQKIKDESNLIVVKIPFSELNGWYFQKDTGNLVHDSGKFFSIEGLSIETNYPNINFRWEQPIINQPEIGILGIIMRQNNNRVSFLMQAKVEPGNVNVVQIAPTVQATWSNYMQVHSGQKPSLLNYFFGKNKSKVIIDYLESEQGARFFKKRNRNMIVKTDDDIDFSSNFRWITLDEIIELMKVDNLINMETRSVLACYLSNIFLYKDNPRRFLHTGNEIIGWLSKLKSKYYKKVKLISMAQINDWEYLENEIRHRTQNFFSVIAVSMEVYGREVQKWTQPLIKQNSIGTIGFLMKKINGISHFLVQGRMEAGYFDIVEMGPTISTSDITREKLPYSEFFINPPKEKVMFSTVFSEEGGRFYHTQNRYMIINVDENDVKDVPENYIWMTLRQLKDFMPYFGHLNVEIRSLISCIADKF